MGSKGYMWMTAGANVTGLFLSVPRVFRFGHPSLFIPWSETLTDTSVENWFGYDWDYLNVWIPNVPGAYIRFEKKLAKCINGVAFLGISF